jgi:putative solute:sodium symporter small subunit
VGRREPGLWRALRRRLERVGGFPLGFWFAQQGSILVFVVLILIYALAMSRLDRQHHEEIEAASAPAESRR